MIKHIFITLPILLLFFNCQTDTTKKPTTAELLIGKWELAEAMRDNKPTTSLDGAYFIFDEAGMLASNFYGTEVKSPYSLKNEDKVIYHDNQYKTDYNIQLLEENKLVLLFSVRNTKFNLSLKKVKKE